ncbi:hypothetical protein [Leadbetterella sp. DM7]|uniref:hypothetical protein n=1 Tax=Leadbetterella sp. DM7 TaxID=3235085 RepID=UPI00349E6057
MSHNTKTTSKSIASKASKILTNPSSSRIAKELAGSALSQAQRGHQTGAILEDKASKVLQSDKFSESTKALAGSVLSQSNKKR